MYIIHQEGSYLQEQTGIVVVSFLNDLAVVFFYVACSLNLIKWLAIINRVYLYAGKMTPSRFKVQEHINVGMYVFFVASGAIINITLSGIDLYEKLYLNHPVSSLQSLNK